MKTIICVSLLLCVTLAYASALPSEAAGSANQPAVAVSAGVEDDVLEGAEQRWGWGGGRGWGGRGWGGGYGGGRGWGGGYGGGRGWGGGYGGGYGGGWGGRGWGGRGYGWGR